MIPIYFFGLFGQEMRFRGMTSSTATRPESLERANAAQAAGLAQRLTGAPAGPNSCAVLSGNSFIYWLKPSLGTFREID